MHTQAGAVAEEPRANEGQLQKHQRRSQTPNLDWSTTALRYAMRLSETITGYNVMSV